MQDIDSINIEPSWRVVAEIAIIAMKDGNVEGKRGAEEIIRDMGDKLARLRAQRPDCPEHLRDQPKRRLEPQGNPNLDTEGDHDRKGSKYTVTR